MCVCEEGRRTGLVRPGCVIAKRPNTIRESFRFGRDQHPELQRSTRSQREQKLRPRSAQPTFLARTLSRGEPRGNEQRSKILGSGNCAALECWEQWDLHVQATRAPEDVTLVCGDFLKLFRPRVDSCNLRHRIMFFFFLSL